MQNKLQLIRYILNHDDELLSWYCKESFNLPLPDDLTHADVHTYGTGYYGDLCDMIIEDGLSRNIITDDDL